MQISSDQFEVKHLKMPHDDASKAECAVAVIRVSALPQVGNYINDRQIIRVDWSLRSGERFYYEPTIWSKPPHKHDWISMNNGFDLCKGCSIARLEGEEKNISTEGSV